MNTKILEYVLAIAEEQSFSNAAKRLFISQPSLSQSISTLEKTIGLPLFDRSSVPLSLTYAGERYVEYAIKVLNLHREMEMLMGDIRGAHSGQLIIGISLFRNSTILLHVFPIFHKLYPNVKLIVKEGINESIEEMAVNGQLDISFINRTIPSSLTGIKLLTDNVLLAVRKDHPMCKGHLDKEGYPPVDLRIFKDEFFALTSTNSNLRTIADSIFQTYGFAPKIAIETYSLDLAHQFAINGGAHAIILGSLLNLYPEKKQACYFSFDAGTYTNDLYICYKKSRYVTAIMRDFIRITIETIEKQNLLYSLKNKDESC